jgi:hypothetical protein
MKKSQATPTMPRLLALATALLWVSISPLLRAEQAQDPFSHDQVVPIAIEIDPFGLRALRQAPRESVRARIRVGTNESATLNVRLKGRGSFRPIDDKPSFSLKLSSDASKGFFGGREKVLLNNSSQDRSFLRWKVASELFLQAELPAARVNFATVTLNNKKLGLYLLVEGTDKQFLEGHFGSASGTLYEGSNQDVNDALEVDFSAKGTDHSDLRTLAQTCDEADLEERWKNLKAKLDTERFAAFLAMEIIVGHHDGYSLDRNNFRIYHDPGLDRLVFIPHGLDLIFPPRPIPTDPRCAGLVASAFLETPQGRELYERKFRELGTMIYGDTEGISKRINTLLNIIGANAPDQTTTPRNLRQEADLLKSSIQIRAKSFHEIQKH